jgi:hypothetical protein
VLRFWFAALAFAVAGPLIAQPPARPETAREEFVAAVENGALRVATDCSETRPCKARFGSVVRLIKTAGTVKVAGQASGQILLYVDASGALIAGSTLNLTCEGCKYARGATQFPSDAIPLFTWTVVKGVLAQNGTDFRTEFATKPIASGPGILTTDDEGKTTVAVDPTLVGLHVLVPPKTSESKCTAGEFSFDSDYYYVCVAPNKWKRLALSNF